MAKSQVIGSQYPHRIKSRTTRLKCGSLCTLKQTSKLLKGVATSRPQFGLFQSVNRWIEIVALHVFEQARTNVSGDESNTAGRGHVPGRTIKHLACSSLTRTNTVPSSGTFSRLVHSERSSVSATRTHIS